MKRLIFILLLLVNLGGFSQDLRVIDWKTKPEDITRLSKDTFDVTVPILDFNDAGVGLVGNYFIDYVGRCFSIIDSLAIEISYSNPQVLTVVDLQHEDEAPQGSQVGRVYQSVYAADSAFQSIGGIDVSVLDDLGKWRKMARDEELFSREIKRIHRTGDTTLTAGKHFIRLTDPFIGYYNDTLMTYVPACFGKIEEGDIADVRVCWMDTINKFGFFVYNVKDCTVYYDCKLINK